MKISYSQELLDEKSSEIVKKSLKADCEIWLSGVQLTLEEFSGKELLPSRILLCGGASALPEIKDALESSAWHKNLSFAKKPKVEFIQTEEVNNVIDKTEKLKNPQDITPMALANTAMDFIGEESLMDGVLNKVMKGFRE